MRLIGELDGAPLHLTREVRSQSGYFSGDTSRLHFGIPREATLTRLEILWPDGTLSSIANLRANALVSVTYPPRQVDPKSRTRNPRRRSAAY